VPTTATDAVITTTANTSLTLTGGTPTTFESLTLPKGSWVLQAANTAVSFEPPDYYRCTILAGDTTVKSHTATSVGPRARPPSQRSAP
jgi:hypothetical protein